MTSDYDHSEVKVCQLCPNSFQPHGLYSPWDSPGQNTGVCSLSLLNGVFPTQELNWGEAILIVMCFDSHFLGCVYYQEPMTGSNLQ